MFQVREDIACGKTIYKSWTNGGKTSIEEVKG
jgi:hypothetical protein